MSAAIESGETLFFLSRRTCTTEMCAKCKARFVAMPGATPRIDSSWCPNCNTDPTSDLMEDQLWSTTKEQPFIFAGWKFSLRLSPHREHGACLRLWKRLPYPEAPGLDLSYSEGHVSQKARLAAWLTGHWYEHLFNICPCQNGVRDKDVDEGEGSNFRKAVIESLLWYHERGLV